MEKSRLVIDKLIASISFLAKWDLVLRGDTDESANLNQLLRL